VINSRPLGRTATNGYRLPGRVSQRIWRGVDLGREGKGGRNSKVAVLFSG
jgi:hypothetical protein